MGLIIDTCILIHAEHSRHTINFNQWQHYGKVYLSVITVSELLIGTHRAHTEAIRLRRSAYIEGILKKIAILDFTTETARIHAELCAYLMVQGQMIGANDLIIAATAVANGYALVTKNHREFKRIPGLTIVSD